MKLDNVIRQGEKQMSAQTTMANTVDPDGKWLDRVGGISALAFGIAYIIIIALYVPMGAAPSDAEAKLTYLAENTTPWWGIIGLSVLTDFLLVPVALALYVALQGTNRNLMLLATAFVGLFVVLDLPLTWLNFAVLMNLSGSYAAATSEAQRAVFVAAAQYSSAVINSSLIFVYNTLTLSIGILLTGLAMLKGIFNKGTAYVGVVTGILGVVAVAGSYVVSAFGTIVVIIASTLTMVWVFLIGYRLLRRGQQ